MADEIVPLLITEKAAARLMSLSDSTLIAARFRGTPLLPFVRIGKRSIRYRLSDVKAFVGPGTERTPIAPSAQGDRVIADAVTAHARPGTR